MLTEKTKMNYVVFWNNTEYTGIKNSSPLQKNPQFYTL